MPVYEIEQYEIHTQKYQIEAATEAEAIAMLLNGEGEAMDDRLEYIEVAEDIGLPVEEHPELVAELGVLGIRVGEHVIPSIRGIEEVE